MRVISVNIFVFHPILYLHTLLTVIERNIYIENNYCDQTTYLLLVTIQNTRWISLLTM